MIDTRQLRYFIAVAETLHFGRAAQRLNVTQPPLSRQVAALEQALGVRLIDRHSRRATLTPAGERFLDDARHVLQSLDQAVRNAQAAQAGELGELTIAFMMHAAYSSLPPLTRRFTSAHPGVKLHLLETLPSMLADGVLEGRFDAAIGFRPVAMRGIVSTLLHQEPLCAVMPADHPLAERRELRPEHVAGEAMIMSPESVTPTLRLAITQWLSPAGEPEIRLETQLQQTIVSLVGEGLGVAIVPQSLDRLKMAGVAFRPLVEPPVVEHVLMYRQGSTHPVLPRLLAAVQ